LKNQGYPPSLKFQRGSQFFNQNFLKILGKIGTKEKMLKIGPRFCEAKCGLPILESCEAHFGSEVGLKDFTDLN